MKKRIKIILCASLVALLSACDGTMGSSDKDSDSDYKSESYKLVETAIEEMGNEFWNKKQYLEIRDSQIPELRKQSERDAAGAYLDATYGKVLVRDAGKILSSGCNERNAHSLLSGMMSELRPFSDVPGQDEVEALYSRHSEAQQFVNSAVGSQRVYSYRDNYDKSYETSKIAEAKQYLSDDRIRCESIRSSLSTLSSNRGYNARRKRYCESIVDLYLQCTNPAVSELNIAKGKLNIYSGDKSEWRTKMEEHYESIQPEEDE